MKLLLSLIIVLYTTCVCCKAASTDDTEECAWQNKVDLKMLQELTTSKDFPPTREMNCFAACILKKDGVINEDGTLSPEAIDGLVVKACKITAGNDACETAARLMDCVASNPW